MSPSSPERNREQWLTELAKALEPSFGAYKLGPYRLTCGWPCRGGLSTARRRVGECHGIESSKGGVHELFIRPVLETIKEVGGTVAHEMAHVAAGVKAAHGKAFVKVCSYVGLTKGKPTSVGPGPRLEEKILRLAERLGPYPHSALVPRAAVKKPPTSRRLVCVGCGCVVTISYKWLSAAGAPICGCGKPMLNPDEETEENENDA